jgi:hypothetical protein
VKQILSISLLALLLYNAFGYYLLFGYERQKARIDYMQELPESAFQKMSYKLVDYTTIHNTEFEYVDNELIIEGKTFHIIKKRILNDTLHLYYLPNTRQDALRESFSDLVETQTVTKQSDNKGSPLKQLLKNFLKDYIPNDIFVLVVRYPNQMLEAKVLGKATHSVPMSPYLSINAPPPEAA